MNPPPSSELPPFAGRHAVTLPTSFERTQARARGERRAHARGAGGKCETRRQRAQVLGKLTAMLARGMPSRVPGSEVGTLSPKEVALEHLRADAAPLLLRRAPPIGAPPTQRPLMLKLTMGGFNAVPAADERP